MFDVRHKNRRRWLWLGALLGVLACSGDDLPAVRYTETAGALGVDFRHHSGAAGEYHYPETFGAGVAWVDVDDDGWHDLYLVQSGSLVDGPNSLGANRLYRNVEGSRFEDVTDRFTAGDTGYGMGVAAADVDANGQVDLYVTNVGANSLLLQRQGRFRRLDGVADDGRWGTGCGFADVDLDGDLDLIVVNYVHFSFDEPRACAQGSVRSYCDPDAYTPQGDVLYRNDLVETGRFGLTDVTGAWGFTGVGRSLGLAVWDLDLDGDSELYVANDGEQNFLYRNDRIASPVRSGDPSSTGMLTEIGLVSGVRFNAEGLAEAGMGVVAGDLDEDGYPDLVVANFARETHTLYRQSDPLRFRDETRQTGLARSTFMPLGFGLVMHDADLDGDLDLFSAHGHVLDQAARIDASLTYEQPDGLYLWQDGRFIDASPGLGDAWSDPAPGRSAAAADFDGDGDLDLLVTHVNGAPRLLRNDTPPRGQGLEIRLTMSDGANRAGWGSRIEVQVGDRVLTRQLQPAGSYLSAGPDRLHLGIGHDATAVRVIVHWVGGDVEAWDGLPARGRIDLRQGEGSPVEP